MEDLFMYLLPFHVYFFEEISVQVFCSFFNWVIYLFLLLNYMSSWGLPWWHSG